MTEVSFNVRECIYSWTAAFDQTDTRILVRIRLKPDADVTEQKLNACKRRWKEGIEEAWSDRFGCVSEPGSSPRPLTVAVQWVETGQHLTVRVKRGAGRSNLSLWHSDDGGRTAAHEVGHLLGHPDEYEDPNCPTRDPVNTNTLMHNLTDIAQRHCNGFCNRLGEGIIAT
ncbi:MAG: hypothetical protein IT535_10900 [Bauldia sp.]|nr:hypothetical protein [Bauldia sp.]